MSLHHTRNRWFFCVAVSLATLIAACARDNTTAPMAVPSFRAGIDPSSAFPDFGAVKVCNFFIVPGVSGAGTYQVNVNGVDVGGPITLANDEQCAVVWETPGNGAFTIKVTQIGANCTEHLAVRQLDASGNPVLVFSESGSTNSWTATVTTANGLSDTGLSLWFQNGSGGCNPPPPVCEDENATNNGGPLPCIYPGKTFTIGPSSMEGAIKISNGDWVNGGYSFKFKSNTHLATNFSVAAFVTITGPCIGGGPATDTFTFPLNSAVYAVPAGNTNWLPTGDANSVLSWQGSVIASGICGGIGQLDARRGAVFTATVSQNPASGSLVDFRFKYRDPKAKGKPNTNCLDTSDPNRAKADVCGASWSQTVLDP